MRTLPPAGQVKKHRFKPPVNSTGKSPLFLVVLFLLAAVYVNISGCRTVTGEPSFLVTVPTPEQALQWAKDKYDPDRRREALKWLMHADWADTEVYRDIYKTLAEDEDPTVRTAAMRALGRHGRPEDVTVVLKRLAEDDSEMVRREAALTLQRIHNDDAIEPLLKAMSEDPSAPVRAAAAAALGQYPRNNVLEALIVALDDENLEVSEGARRSLTYLTGKNFRYNTVAWLAWLKQADNPFAGQQTYVYQTFHRDPNFFETLVPIFAPPNETPGIPRGMSTGDAAGKPADNSGNTSEKVREG